MIDLRAHLLERLGQVLPLAPLPGYEDLARIRALDGREVGFLRAWTAPGIDKLVTTSLAFAPGAAYGLVHAVPAADRIVPRLLWEGMTAGPALTFSLDLYPALDLAADPLYMARHYDRLARAFDAACASTALAPRPSAIPWVRAICSPFFLMSPVALDRAVEALPFVEAYLEVWLAALGSEPEVDATTRALIEERRRRALDTLIERDPHRPSLERLLGTEATARLARAML